MYWIRLIARKVNPDFDITDLTCIYLWRAQIESFEQNKKGVLYIRTKSGIDIGLKGNAISFADFIYDIDLLVIEDYAFKVFDYLKYIEAHE